MAQDLFLNQLAQTLGMVGSLVLLLLCIALAATWIVFPVLLLRRLKVMQTTLEELRDGTGKN